MVILKYSKYIYRMYYSIGKALNDKKILELSDKINKQVIIHRSTYDTSKVNYKLLGYNNESIKSYLNKFTDDILKYIVVALGKI
jgi:hypothetical protein